MALLKIQSADEGKKIDQNNGFGNLIPLKLDLVDDMKQQLLEVEKNEMQMSHEHLVKNLIERYDVPQEKQSQIVSQMGKLLTQQ